MKLELCSKEEFDDFIAKYPRPLTRDVFGAGEPPVVTFNDFTIAPKWPESVVASYFAEDSVGPACKWRIARSAGQSGATPRPFHD